MSEAIPNAEYIRALLDGKEVEYIFSGEWFAADVGFIVDHPQFRFRLKPKPAPKREPLTVHVYEYQGKLILKTNDKTPGNAWEPLGEFILQPKEQT